MKTNVELPSDLLKEAMRVTHVSKKSDVLKLALEALIEKAAKSELAQLGGKVKGFKKVQRR